MANIKAYRIGKLRQAAIISEYASVAEMDIHVHETMQRAANRELAADVERGAGHGPATTWYGVSSFAEVKRILREGYAEGAELVETMYQSIAPSLPRAVDYRRKLVRCDQGDSLDIHAVYRGDLGRAWTTAKRKARLGSGLIRIAVDICGNGHVPAQHLQWRGVAALALSKALTKAGYSVEIVAGQSGRDALRGLQVLTTILCTVKPRYAVLDLATIAATVCLPGFFRYLGFLSIIKQADDYGFDTANGLGSAMALESCLPVPEKISQVMTSSSIYNRENAEQWVKESIRMLQSATLTKEGTR